MTRPSARTYFRGILLSGGSSSIIRMYGMAVHGKKVNVVHVMRDPNGLNLSLAAKHPISVIILMLYTNLRMRTQTELQHRSRFYKIFVLITLKLLLICPWNADFCASITRVALLYEPLEIICS